MKRFFIYSFCILSLFVTGCSKDGDWKLVKEVSIPSEADSNIAGFHNEQLCISCGQHGRMMYSSDGGKTWARGENSSLCRYALDIVDEKIAWTCGNGNNVRITRDGGKTWDAVTDLRLGSTHRAIDFIDDKTGWVSVTRSIAYTGNGGETWTEMPSFGSKSKVLSLSILSEKEGFVFTKDGELLHTEDGGESWDVETVTVGKGGTDAGEIISCDFNFYDRENGEVVLIYNSSSGTYLVWLKTRDGGKTWSENRISHPKDVYVTDVYLTGDGNYVTITTLDKKMKLYRRN